MASLSKSRPTFPGFPTIYDLEIPEELSGANRFPGTPHAITERAFRREVERLLFWCILQHKKALSALVMEDFAEYEQFLRDP